MHLVTYLSPPLWPVQRHHTPNTFFAFLRNYGSKKHHAQVLNKSLTTIYLSGATDDWI